MQGKKENCFLKWQFSMVADDSAMCFSEGQAGKKMKKDRNQMGTLKEENCERKRLSRKQENRGG